MNNTNSNSCPNPDEPSIAPAGKIALKIGNTAFAIFTPIYLAVTPFLNPQCKALIIVISFLFWIYAFISLISVQSRASRIVVGICLVLNIGFLMVGLHYPHTPYLPAR